MGTSVDDRLDIEQSVERLTEKQRWALLLVCYYGYTQSEAAETLGISDRALRYRLSLAERNFGASFEAKPS